MAANPVFRRAPGRSGPLPHGRSSRGQIPRPADANAPQAGYLRTCEQSAAHRLHRRRGVDRAGADRAVGGRRAAGTALAVMPAVVRDVRDRRVPPPLAAARAVGRARLQRRDDPGGRQPGHVGRYGDCVVLRALRDRRLDRHARVPDRDGRARRRERPDAGRQLHGRPRHGALHRHPDRRDAAGARRDPRAPAARRDAGGARRAARARAASCARRRRWPRSGRGSRASCTTSSPTTSA